MKTKALVLIIFVISCFAKRPAQEIKPTWKYQGTIMLHGNLYQHLFIDSTGTQYPIYSKSKNLILKINQ